MGEDKDVQAADAGRRDVLRKALFVAPVVLTLAVVPSFGSAGSGNDKEDKDKDKDKDKNKDK
jgi:hypothetical protein